jgi:perosamine synthetase
VQQAWHLYVVQLQLDRLTITRDEMIQQLKAQNIGTSVHFIPLHLHPYYRSRGWDRSQFPVATAAFNRILSLPVYPRMSDGDVEDVIEAVRSIVLHHRRRPVSLFPAQHAATRVAVTELQ